MTPSLPRMPLYCRGVCRLGRDRLGPRRGGRTPGLAGGPGLAQSTRASPGGGRRGRKRADQRHATAHITYIGRALRHRHAHHSLPQLSSALLLSLSLSLSRPTELDPPTTDPRGDLLHLHLVLLPASLELAEPRASAPSTRVHEPTTAHRSAHYPDPASIPERDPSPSQLLLDHARQSPRPAIAVAVVPPAVAAAAFICCLCVSPLLIAAPHPHALPPLLRHHAPQAAAQDVREPGQAPPPARPPARAVPRGLHQVARAPRRGKGEHSRLCSCCCCCNHPLEFTSR